jgi:peptide/nickel transport system substrate-binding protein
MPDTVRSALGGRSASRRRWSRLLALLMAFGLVAAACGDSDDDTSAPGGDAAPTEPADTDGNGNGAVDDEVASGGTLRYGDSLGPSRFDAHRSTIGQDIRFFAPVYDRLVHLSAEGDFIPGLATDWSFSDDGLSMELNLRQGVTFHDGEPFNAEAVKANLERGQTVEGSSVAADLADITAIEAVDEHTVRLTLDQPNAILPGLFSHRAGVMISPAAFDNPDLDVAPVGAGMYRVAEYRIDDRIIYERYEDYWDTEAAGPDTIELRILADDQTRMNALRSGEVDVAILRGTQIDEAEMSGFNVHSQPALTYLVLYLNRAQAEFENELVRRAMNHAIDRQGIIDAVLFGAGDAAVQPFPEGYFAYNPDYPGDYYEYDPDRARELLAEAGLPDGFEFEMLVTALGVYVQAGEAVQAMLAEVGINANIRQVEAAQTADVYYAQQDGDALVSQWGGRPDPQMTMELQFTSTGFSNPGRHTTPEFEELNAQAKAALDADDRAELLREMSGAVAENAFQVPIAHDHGVYAYSDSVVNFETLITGQPNFRVMGVNQ